LANVGPLEADAFLVAVALFAAAGFAAVFLLGAARVALSEAEDPASESMSTAEYWRLVADLLGGMFASLYSELKANKKDWGKIDVLEET
jgi:hypothetical protein